MNNTYTAQKIEEILDSLASSAEAAKVARMILLLGREDLPGDVKNLLQSYAEEGKIWKEGCRGGSLG